MVSKKLASLLASAVLLGQIGSVASVFAQAETQLPDSQTEKLQVASVIQHTDIDTASDAPAGNVKPPATPDIYTIGGSKGTLPVIIQVLQQTDDITSLYVNGSEVTRLFGVMNGRTSYARVKAMADRLNSLLVTDTGSIPGIVPVLQKGEDGKKQPVVKMGGAALVNAEPQNFQSNQQQELRQAFMTANRLRQVLGAAPLKEKDFFPDKTVAGTNGYKGTGRTQVGMASWYGGFFHGRRAADGSRFNQNALTAAHRTLPFGTMVRVVNQRTHKDCLVKITDRGPFVHNRIIDLSRGAAQAIGMMGSGVARVSLEVVKRS